MGYAKSSLYILERFSVGIHKSTPIYLGILLCRGTQSLSAIFLSTLNLVELMLKVKVYMYRETQANKITNHACVALES